MSTTAATLEQIRSKVEAGGRLSADDGRLLFSPAADLHADRPVGRPGLPAHAAATPSITTSTPT